MFLDESTWVDYRQKVGAGAEADTRGILAQRYQNRRASGSGTHTNYFTCDLFQSGITQTTFQASSDFSEYRDFNLSFSPLLTEEYPSNAFRGLCLFFPMSQVSMLFSGQNLRFSDVAAYFATDTPAQTAQIMQRLVGQVGSSGRVVDTQRNYQSLLDNTRLLRLFGLSFAGLLGLVAVVNLFSVISASLSARARELAALSSVGLGRKRMRRMLGYECICYSLWGALPGLVAAHLCTWQVVWRLYGDVWEQGYHPPWAATLIILGAVACVVAAATWRSVGRWTGWISWEPSRSSDCP